jgi:hypothetical protein
MALVHDIDFVNQKDRISGDSLTFARTGEAVYRDGSVAATGVMRTDSLAASAFSEYTALADHKVWATTANYIYAENNGVLKRAANTDPLVWTAVYTPLNGITSCHVTANGTLLLGIAVQGGDVSGTVVRGVDDVFTEVVADGFLTDGTRVMPWGWSEVGGRIVMGEYKSLDGSGDEARNVYISDDDGLTWSAIHSPANVTGRHLHKVVGTILDGVTTVYAAHGDSDKYLITKLVDNATTAWTASTVPLLEIGTQPTGAIWVPEAGKIIWGTDGSVKPRGIISHTLSNDTFVFDLHVDIPNAPSTAFNYVYNFLSMMKIDGLYYATGNRQSTQTFPYSGVWVSTDAINWRRVINYDDSEMYLAGKGVDGNIWVNTVAGDSYYFPPVNSQYLKGALIERSGDQKYLVTPTADAGTTVDNSYGVDKWTGTTCNRWTSDAPITDATHKLTFGIAVMNDITAGDIIYLTVWVKGSVGDGAGNNKGEAGRFTLLAQTYDNDDIGGTTDETTISFYPVSDHWQKIVCPVVSTHTVVVSGKSRMKGWIYAQGSTADVEFDILVDGISYEAGIIPSEWQDAASDRNADVLSYDPTSFPAIFTDIFTVGTRFCDSFYGAASTGEGNSYIYLRAYVEDDTNFFAVVYDVSDSKIKLINEVGGVNTEIATIATAINILTDETLSIAVSRTTTAANLYVYHGGVAYSDSGTITDHTLDRSYYGSHPDGTQGGSQVFIFDQMYNTVLTETEIRDILQSGQEEVDPAPSATTDNNVLYGSGNNVQYDEGNPQYGQS